MARKNVLKHFKMLNAVSMAGIHTSDATGTINIDKASIHVHWENAVGTSTITVQARNGAREDGHEADGWYTLDFGSPIVTSGSSGDHVLVLLETPFTDIRINSTAATSGNLTATLTMKQLGG